MRRSLTSVAITGALVITTACGGGTQPAVNSDPTNGQPAANTAAPTEPEPGSARYLFAHQPDFQADGLIVADTVRIPLRVAKKGEDYRVESEVGGTTQVAYSRAGQPTIMLFPEKKQYIEQPREEGRLNTNPFEAQLEALIREKGLKIEKVGSETVDGHPTTKFRITKPDESGEMVVYTADDLKNLVIRIDVTKENKKFEFTLTNITLNVPPEAVAPPPNFESEYKKVEDAGPLVAPGPDQDAAPVPQGSSQ